MQKLYCYVDETGQDTKGEMFLVSVVVTGVMRDELRKKLITVEQTSKKLGKKWAKARPKQRKLYMQDILKIKELSGHMYYSRYEDTKAYLDLTILSAAKALHDQIKTQYQATVIVDGLGKSERYKFAAGLRKLDISVRKVRGIKEQSDEFIRLADAIAGFVRDGFDGNVATRELFHTAKKNRTIKEI